jgi:GT2 family glycosyltransferase
MLEQDAYRIHLSYSSIKPISNNRNTIVQKFLAIPDCEYLMMIDSDIVPPPNIMRLIDFDKDIITPLMFTRQKGELLPLFLKRDKDGIYSVDDYLNKVGLQEIDATGTGCIIIKREVLEKVNKPFENIYDKDGIKTLGLDLSFCQKAKELGYRSWVHLDYVASHYYTYDLKDLYYITVQKERSENELNNIKEYLKENHPNILAKTMDAIRDKQLIKSKIL